MKIAILHGIGTARTHNPPENVVLQLCDLPASPTNVQRCRLPLKKRLFSLRIVVLFPPRSLLPSSPAVHSSGSFAHRKPFLKSVVPDTVREVVARAYTFTVSGHREDPVEGVR